MLVALYDVLEMYMYLFKSLNHQVHNYSKSKAP